MAQLDKIIKVMLDRASSEILLSDGAEPVLRVEGAQTPHVLIPRKLTSQHLRLLLGEILGEQAVAQLGASDGGEFNYVLNGQAIGVQIRAWNGTLEARLRAGSRTLARPATGTGTGTGAALGRIELAKASMADVRRTATGVEPASRARLVEPARGSSTDGLEADLNLRQGEGRDGREGRAGTTPNASPSSTGDFELDLEGAPPSSSSMSAPSTGRLNSARPSEPPPRPAAIEAPRAEARVTSAGAGEPPIHALFRAMMKQGGSDLHISTGERPMIRKDGDIARLDDTLPRFKGDQVFELIRPLMPQRNLEEFERDHDTDFAYDMIGVARFRGNVFFERRGVGAVFRTIPTEVATVEKLGLSPAIQNLCYLSKGLVLVTGPTGSGKSTTLSALIDLINRTRHDHVVTIEDPIEFVHQSKSCLVNQREVGPHTESFKRALRAALREDPDVVMVGEMRDLETIAIAIETAETGHLVFGTLHTSTAYSTIDRLIDSFPPASQAQIRVMLSESLKGVISQTLCKKIGGGRISAFEVLLVNSAISNLIREGKTFQVPSIMQTSRKAGMVLLNDALMELVEKKKVDPREAYIKAIDKANLVTSLRAAGHKLEFLGGA